VLSSRVVSGYANFDPFVFRSAGREHVLGGIDEGDRRRWFVGVEEMEQGVVYCSRFGVDRTFVTIFDRKEITFVVIGPFCTKLSDFASGVVEGAISPAPGGGVGADQPCGCRRALDAARFVGEAQLGPLFHSR